MEKEKMKNEVTSIFPTPVVKTSLGREFTKNEMRMILDIPMMEKDDCRTNHQSEDSCLFDSHTDTLGDIKKFCENQLKDYLQKIEGVDTNIAGLHITQSWVNKNKPQEQHLSHFHQNSYLSGVLYIKCLPNDGINFDNRMFGMFNNMEFMRKDTTVWNARRAMINVKEGDLLIFPSWILHGVSPNETENKERISLAFNTFPSGSLPFG